MSRGLGDVYKRQIQAIQHLVVAEAAGMEAALQITVLAEVVQVTFIHPLLFLVTHQVVYSTLLIILLMHKQSQAINRSLLLLALQKQAIQVMDM